MAGRPWLRRQVPALFAALLLALAAALLAARDTSAAGHVSGEWHVVMTPAPPSPEQSGRRVPWFEVDCLLYISQDGDMLSSPVACGSGAGAVFFSGTFDKAMMRFSLQGQLPDGILLGMQGTISQGGESAMGSWASSSAQPGVGGGTLMATRGDGWWGDVDCSSRANSIDVLKILQQNAHLQVSLSCQSYGDVNIDGTVSALDAVLILQREAGLIPRLPVL